MSRLLVTGATGLVGAHLVPQLLETHEVHAVVRKTVPAAWDGRVTPVRVDLDAAWSVEALPRRVDAVLHLAQSPHFRQFPERADSVWRVNADATARLLDHAVKAGARTFVLASSGGVYGHGERAFTESDPTVTSGELGFYFTTKLAAELAAQSYARHLRVVVLRFFFVYGAGQSDQMLFPRLLRSVRDGTPITLQGPDGIRLNPIHASDAARAVERALALESGTVVNVAGPEVLTLRRIGDLLGTFVDRAPRYEVQDAPPRHLVADVTRMTELLGAPRARFAEAGLSLVRDEAR